MGRVSLTQLIGLFAIFVSLFSWVGFGVLNLDSQPWAVCLFFLFLFLCCENIFLPKGFKFLCLFLFFSLFVSLLVSGYPDDNFILGRSLFGYCGFFVILIGFYNYLKRYGFPDGVFEFSLYLWIVGGLVELFYPGILEFFSPRRTSEVRGATSFAPEPTFFAIILFFLVWVILVKNQYNVRRSFHAIVVGVIGIVFVAKSSMGILYILLAFVFFVVFFLMSSRFNLRFFLIIASFLFLLFCVFLLISSIAQESRMYMIAINAFSEGNLLDLFYRDGSMNVRLEHVIFPIHGLLYNLFLPGGFEGFGEIRNILAELYGGFFWYGVPSNKIMSWIGDWFYQLGFFGVIIVFGLFWASGDRSKRRYCELGLFFILLLSAIPVALPIIPIMFSCFIFFKLKSNKFYFMDGK